MRYRDSLRMPRFQIALLVLLLAGTAFAQSEARPLRIYFIDVEGGQATLLAAPSGETLLLNAGWNAERDARRIAENAQAAGIKRIDALLITHYHRDHVGEVAGLAGRIPISHVFDHG